MLFLCIATRSRESIVYSILCFRWFLGLLVPTHSARLDSLLFFLEIVLDVGFRLLELLLGVQLVRERVLFILFYVSDGSWAY